MGTDNPSEGTRVEKIDWSHFIGGARVPGLSLTRVELGTGSAQVRSAR